MVTIYHNQECSKSRCSLELVHANEKDVQVIDYLQHPPSAEELGVLVKMLGIKPRDLVRSQEALFKTHYEGKRFSAKQWLNILSQNPILIERPIVVKDGKAVLGRPPEKVLELLHPAAPAV